MNQTVTTIAVYQGLEFLRGRQLDSGGFATSTAYAVNTTNEEMLDFEIGEKKGIVIDDRHSVFPSMLIGLSLLHLSGFANTNEILHDITGFIQSNRKKFGIWQHFSREHELYEVTPCDVDLTAIGSSFLRGMGVDISENRKVILANSNSEGLIYTWFTFRKKFKLNPVFWYVVFRELKNPVKSYYFWKYFECTRTDIDAVVNANVLAYVGLDEKSLPILNWMNDIIANGKEDSCDKWYLKKSTVYYFFSRNYKPGIKALELIRSRIKLRVLNSFLGNGSVENHPLDTALMISTLLNLDCWQDVPKKSIEFLLSSQLTDGSWAKRILYYGGPKRVTGWGSEELTTGYALEALFRRSALVENNELSKNDNDRI